MNPLKAFEIGVSKLKSVTEADQAKWVMDDQIAAHMHKLEHLLRQSSHGLNKSKGGAGDLGMILDSMADMLRDLSRSQVPHQAITDITQSVKILQKTGKLK